MSKRTCEVDGCPKPHKGHGLCEMHLARYRRNGQIESIQGPRYSSVEDRLKYNVVAVGECLHYTRFIKSDGYAIIKDDDGVQRYAHRVAWERKNGPVPEGLELDHLCHTDDLHCQGGASCLHRRCVNPDHLEAVTKSQNQRRGMASFERTGLCLSGKHDVTDPANVQYDSPTARRCRPCFLEGQRSRYYASRTAKLQECN